MNRFSAAPQAAKALGLLSLCLRQAASFLFVALLAGGLIPNTLPAQTGSAPSIFAGPYGGGELDLGGPMDLMVFAYSSSPIAYQWFKDGATIAGATNST